MLEAKEGKDVGPKLFLGIILEVMDSIFLPLQRLTNGCRYGQLQNKKNHIQYGQ